MTKEEVQQKETRRLEIDNLLADENLDHDKMMDLRDEMHTLTVDLHKDDENYISEEDFYERFNMVKNHIGDNGAFDGCMFETYGEELQHVFELSKKTKRVWTYIECDYETTMLVAGFHLVNRLGFIVTEEDYPDDAAYVILE